MNTEFSAVIAASDDDRLALFLAAARRLGTAVQNVEKDFWVCWLLDALFNGLPRGTPRLLFKGGTSLSKAYGLIDRFSEDVDITVFRDDLGQAASTADLEAMSGRKRQARLDAIKAACQDYVNGSLLQALRGIVEHTMWDVGVAADRAALEPDASDADRQTLLFSYPSVSARENDYVRSVIKVEFGARSALDPHRPVVIRPYIAPEAARFDLQVPQVTTIDADRTFWDKLVILHGQRAWFDRRGVLRGGGQRVSRHYYDVFRLMGSDVADHAIADHGLAMDCARHARLFFNSPDLDLQHAVPGTFALMPHNGMLDALANDYRAMTVMIFGAVPDFAEIVAMLTQLENRINRI